MTSDSVPLGPRAVWHYRIAGLLVRSEIPLPLDEDAPGDVDVAVVEATVTLEGHSPTRGRRMEVEGDERVMRLRWPGLAAMSVEHGSRIHMGREEGVAAEEVAPLVLGVGMGLVLHQRGLMVLHASAVALPSGVAAFVGMKGAGKSTMAGAMAARGAAVVADDVLPISLESGTPTAWPGPAALKLWPESATAIGRSPRRLRRLHPRASKRVVTDVGVVSEALPLRAIYALDISERTEIEPQRGQDALVELVRHSYAARFLPELGATPAHFGRCAELTRQVPLFRLSRPAALHQLDDVASLVEEHVAGLT